MKKFEPNYQNIVDVAYNREVLRTPLYEHGVSYSVIEKITGKKLNVLGKTESELEEFFRNYAAFFKEYGYDTVTFEGCVTSVLFGGGALGNHVDPIIKTMDDFKKYPFGDVKNEYFKVFDRYFSMLKKCMPSGMKAIGGVGNGVFEVVQDLVGYENLMLLSYDDEELYEALYKRVGDMLVEIWMEFMKKHGDIFCVLRFGDDLGYKSNTLLPHKSIRTHIIPQYKRIIEIVHSYNKPFLLHSCGCIFDVFEDIINITKINAKHSNEDAIAPFSKWVDLYGDRIGNFGGIDTDYICTKDEQFIRNLVTDTMKYCGRGHGGFALASGNSIADYVDPGKYLCMINTAREYRGDSKK